MNPNNEGFTVGELIISVSVIIIAFFIWSGIKQKGESQTSQQKDITYSLVAEK